MSNITVTLSEVRADAAVAVTVCLPSSDVVLFICYFGVWMCETRSVLSDARCARGVSLRAVKSNSPTCQITGPDAQTSCTRTAKRVDLPQEFSAADYLLDRGRFHVRHEEVHHCSSAFNEPENERGFKLVHFSALVPAG